MQPTLEDAAKKADPDYQLSKEEERLVSSSNAFSLKLFQLLANKKGKESVALSPMAVIYSLNMLNNGANGKTQEVISKALGYTADDLDDINSLSRTILIGQRKGGIDEQNDSSGYMITANFLIMNGQTKLLPDFQEVLEHDYFTNIIDAANTPKGKERANKLCKDDNKRRHYEPAHQPHRTTCCTAFQCCYAQKRLGLYRSIRSLLSPCHSIVKMGEHARFG